MTRSSSSRSGTWYESLPGRGEATRRGRKVSRWSSSARLISARLLATTSRASATGGPTNGGLGASGAKQAQARTGVIRGDVTHDRLVQTLREIVQSLDDLDDEATIYTDGSSPAARAAVVDAASD